MPTFEISAKETVFYYKTVKASSEAELKNNLRNSNVMFDNTDVVDGDDFQLLEVKQITDESLKNGFYELVDGKAWFNIKNFDINIYATDEGVCVDVYDPDTIMCGPMHKVCAKDSDIPPKGFT